MLDLRQYTCLGAALRDALDRFSSEVCLIEAERDREKVRLTYSDFKEIALPLARAMEDADFDPGDRAAIIMTNQSKWLISAYAIFYCGGVLVPLDYKLTAAEHLQLLAHSKAKVLIVEYHLWRAITQSPDFQKIATKIVLVTEAPLGVELAGAFRWEDFKRKGAPDFVMRQKDDVACIIYSSGTGGRPKGCVLTHENYLEQCIALTTWYPFWPGVRYLSILPTNHAIDFMVGFIGPFVCGACVVHLRTLRPEFVREAFAKYQITYVSLVPLVLAAGLSVLGAQFGNNASAGLLYPTAFRAKGVGWALGVGRFGAIAGQLAGGVLLAMHLPVRSLFLMASLPMVVGTVAAALLIPICYARLGTLTLDDAPLVARAGQPRGVFADPARLRAPMP